MTISVPKALTWIGSLLAALVLVLIIFEGGGNQNYVVYARFADAGGLLPNFFVKIDQVQAGVVKSIDLNKAENQVIVKMVLNSSAAPIGPGASAYIRPVNLLGEKYVELNPGNLQKPLPSGSTIPVTRTGTPIELDDLFNTLDPSTRSGLGLVINEAGLAMAGQSSNFMQTLRDLPPTLSQARQVVGEVAQSNAALEQAIVNGNQDLTTVNSKKQDLQSLIQQGQLALRSINTAKTQLGQTLDSAPGGLAQLRTSLAQLQISANALTPAAADLQRTTPSLAATLIRLPNFVTDANAALGEARQVAPALARLGTQSAPILAQMRPATATLARFSKAASPFLTALDQQGGLQQFLGFVAGWAGVTSTRDGLGHLFRLRLSLDNQFLTSALGKYASLFGITGIPARKHVTAGTPAAGLLPAASATPAPAAAATPKPSGLAGVLAPVKQKLGGIVGGLKNTVNRGVTGIKGAVGGVTAGLGRILGGTLGGILGGSNSTGSQAAPQASQSGITSRLLKFLIGS
ncbi:MAG: MlaD family protein [Solirubrobacteraceae bacterium]